MPPLMERIEREVLSGKQRTKNRLREHRDHDWVEIRRCLHIALMDCPCGWTGWLPCESIDGISSRES